MLTREIGLRFIRGISIAALMLTFTGSAQAFFVPGDHRAALTNGAAAAGSHAAGLPAGLSADDWAQIKALLPTTAAAYITPSQQAYLKASNTDASDYFGYSVAISGNTLVVGAKGEDSNATGVNGNQSNNSAPATGAAYVFTRSGTAWSQQAYLKASNPGVGDYFGSSVAISGDTIVVAAFPEDSNATGVNGNQSNNLATNSGAAYVFTRSGTAWSQQAYLKASNTGVADYFGYSVAISGDTIVVGAEGEDSNATGVNGDQSNNLASGAGAAYVFTRSGSAWFQQAYLKASNTDAGDLFGVSVAISGDTIVVGATLEDSNATGVNGDQSNNSASGAGAAYVFTRSGTPWSTAWSQQAYLKASNTDVEDGFGYPVAISGDTIVVGAVAESGNATGVNGDQSNNSASGARAAYVFTRSGTAWSQQAYLKASNTGAGGGFGYSAAISGDTLVIGPAYVFTRSGTAWSQRAYLKASNTDASDAFGSSVAISGETIMVGAYGEASNATGVNGDQSNNSDPYAGAAYVFATPATVRKTFLSTGAQDGWVLESGENTRVGGTRDSAATTFRLGDNAARKQYRGVLSFSTGAGLPDTAVITKITFKIRKSAVVGGGNPLTMFQGFMLDIKKGAFGSSAALQNADFQAAPSHTYGPSTPAVSGSWYSINLTSAKAYINKLGSGVTQIRLRFKLDDNNNATANYLTLFSGDAPLASRPQLIIVYYVP